MFKTFEKFCTALLRTIRITFLHRQIFRFKLCNMLTGNSGLTVGSWAWLLSLT